MGAGGSTDKIVFIILSYGFLEFCEHWESYFIVYLCFLVLSHILQGVGVVGFIHDLKIVYNRLFMGFG